MADSQTYSGTDLHALAHVYPVANADAYTCADLHPVPDTEGRADLHAIPDLYPLADVDTDTCAYCHGGAYADTDRNCANTDPCANSYGSTDTDANRDSANGDTGSNCDSCTHANANRCADRHTCSNSNSNAGPDTDAFPE